MPHRSALLTCIHSRCCSQPPLLSLAPATTAWLLVCCRSCALNAPTKQFAVGLLALAQLLLPVADNRPHTHTVSSPSPHLQQAPPSRTRGSFPKPLDRVLLLPAPSVARGSYRGAMPHDQGWIPLRLQALYTEPRLLSASSFR